MFIGFKHFKNNLLIRWKSGSNRSKLAIKNIIFSLVFKSSSVLASLLIVPMTIEYIDATEYGIWLTLSSIVAWASFFNLGLSNGFKNRFAEAKAKDDYKLAKEYVSTTYIILSIIIVLLIGITSLINQFLDWSSILNVNEEYSTTLHKVFLILLVVLCINMVANIFIKMTEADQHPAIGSLIICIGQILSLVSISILTKFTKGSILKLALFFSSVPVLTLIFASFFMFNFGRYRLYRPSLKFFRKDIIKDIMTLGVKFFSIGLCLIIVFHLMNIVISREIGPIAVTQYNIANKYFSIVYMISVIIVTPMWSAFTDAYTRKDFIWMKATLYKLEIWIGVTVIMLFLLFVFSPVAYRLWIGDSVEIPRTLSILVMLLIIAQIGGNIYTTIVCGVGAMHLQFLIYFCFALISYPLMTYFCRQFGVAGITFVPILVYIFQIVICRIQLWKIINRQASGIWLK